MAPALIGFETLRALKQACDECGLSRTEVEDIFWCASLAAAFTPSRKLLSASVAGGAQGQRAAAVRRADAQVPAGAPR